MRVSNVELVGRVRDALDASVEVLDQSTLLRLQQARQTALATLSSRPAAPSRWVPAMSVAATFVIALGVWQFVPSSHGPDASVVSLDTQEVDLMENLDFVAWMVIEDGRG